MASGASNGLIILQNIAYAQSIEIVVERHVARKYSVQR